MNLLLARLSASGFERLRSELEPMALEPGKVIYEQGAPEEDLYFISSGVVSLVEVTSSGVAAEVALVGKEGVLGIDLFMGGATAPWRMVARTPGEAFRLNADALAWQFARDPDLRRLLLRFTQALMAQIAQTAVCNRHHSIEQQLCRWLLAVLDRLGIRDLAARGHQHRRLPGAARRAHPLQPRPPAGARPRRHRAPGLRVLRAGPPALRAPAFCAIAHTGACSKGGMGLASREALLEGNSE